MTIINKYKIQYDRYNLTQNLRSYVLEYYKIIVYFNNQKSSSADKVSKQIEQKYDKNLSKNMI